MSVGIRVKGDALLTVLLLSTEAFSESQEWTLPRSAGDVRLVSWDTVVLLHLLQCNAHVCSVVLTSHWSR